MVLDPAVGRRFWSELHTYAWLYPDQPSADHQRDARAWLADFTRRLATAARHCPCSSEWSRITTRWPACLDSRTSFYWWTVWCHDQVNARLSKAAQCPWLPPPPYPFQPASEIREKG